MSETPELGMKFGLDSIEKIVSHWMLQSTDVVAAIAETPAWKSDHTLVARVTVNGIELPFEVLDKFIYEYLEREYAKLQAKFADPARAAEDRAEEILRERAEGVVEKLYELANVLESSSNLIRPYWEREVQS